MLIEALPYRDPFELVSPFASESGTILLESARPHPELGRYSFIGVDPFDTVIGHLDDMHDALTVLNTKLNTYRQPSAEVLAALPGAAMGYLSYDLCARLEKITLPVDKASDWPTVMMGFYDVLLTVDHMEKRLWLVSTGDPERTARARMKRARRRMNWMLERVSSIAPFKPNKSVVDAASIRSNFSKASYERAVRKVIDYIRAGDIFEANIAQRFSTRWPCDLSAFEVYQRMRQCNAAPFAAYLNYQDRAIVSASPERFLWLKQGMVETRPIKGTRPRGHTLAEDQAYAEALKKSEKDRAENTMIVDLMRNDLSRVCQPHSVQVPQLCNLESFETVHHLVSVVRGQLRQGLNAIDLLRACFPGGSITGAPKVRSMQIIAELESCRRGPYCGAIGYLGFDGRMDTSVVIRTFLFQGQHITFQGGGAVTLDSDPQAEYEETLAKVLAMQYCLVNWDGLAH